MQIQTSEEWVATITPVHITTVDNDTADSGAMATDPFGGTLHHDVGPMLQRLAHIAALPEGVVHNQRHTVLLGNGRELIKVRDIVPRIPDGLDISILDGLV